MINRLAVTGLLALLLLWLAGCGTSGVGTLGGPAADSSHGAAGVRLGGYEVIRYNANGLPDPALNSTLSLDLKKQDGQTGLQISVHDGSYTNAVELDVRYDGREVHPDRTEFHGALGSGT